MSDEPQGAQWSALPRVPNKPVVSENQIVSIHTASGTPLYDFTPHSYDSLLWTRTRRDTSRCELSVPTSGNEDAISSLLPFVHHCSVYDETGEQLYWTGPLISYTGNRNSISVTCNDVSAYFKKTRNPLTKRWDATDASDIAGELCDAMIENKGLNTRAVRRPHVESNPFNYTTTADAQELDQTIADLVQLGLTWTVISGVLLLGPMPLGVVTEFDENDFLGEGPTVGRDGSQMFNDILVRAQADVVSARVDYGGQQLETIVTVDSIFSASNAARAAEQYAKYVAAPRDNVTMPGSAVLAPDAPVSVEELVPSARFGLSAYTLLTLQELESVECKIDSGTAALSVSMESVTTLPELFDVTKYKAIG